jgi:hypothetical protein
MPKRAKKKGRIAALYSLSNPAFYRALAFSITRHRPSENRLIADFSADYPSGYVGTNMDGLEILVPASRASA